MRRSEKKSFLFAKSIREQNCLWFPVEETKEAECLLRKVNHSEVNTARVGWNGIK